VVHLGGITRSVGKRSYFDFIEVIWTCRPLLSGAPLYDFARYRGLSFAHAASGRRQPHVELAAGRLGIAQKRLGARQRLTAFESGDCGLACAHPGG
jgi:hypothetical protein